MRKKILIHSIVFSPDGVSTAYLYNDIALAFSECGYDVVVLTTTPHYNVLQESLKKQPLRKRLLGLYYESDFQGIKVKHVPQKKFKQTIFRMIGFVYWHILSFLMGLFEKRVALFLSPSPPLTIGFINILLGKLKRAKVIYNVQEIYPDFLIEQGGLQSKTVISLLKLLERFVYNHSDAVTTIDTVFYETIVNRFKDSSKLHIIPNFVDTDLYQPIKADENALANILFSGSPQTIKVMYAANLGHAQDWDPLLDAAIRLKNDPIEFFIIGEGVMKEYIVSQVEKYKLEKVHILPYQARELMPSVLAYSDLQFIFMSPEMENHGFPSKVYTIMACAKPLLVCSGENTPIYTFLKELDCAYLISEKNKKEKVDKIVEILRSVNKEDLKEKGKLGLNEITENYSNHAVTRQYVRLSDKLVLNG